jgi:hypothetical protein
VQCFFMGTPGALNRRKRAVAGPGSERELDRDHLARPLALAASRVGLDAPKAGASPTAAAAPAPAGGLSLVGSMEAVWWY